MELFESLLTEGKTQFHVVKYAKDYLLEHGFRETTLTSDEEYISGQGYFLSPYDSMLVAFVAGASDALRIACAHTDFPMLKLKPQPFIKKSGFTQLNVEPYGGLIKTTWFDRPLGIAGKVALQGENIFKPKAVLFDTKKPVCIIPSLAPHLQKSDSKNDLDVQKEMLPIFSLTDADKAFEDFDDYLADAIKVDKADILDYDLYLYISDLPTRTGINGEFLMSPRIDNLSSVSAILEALTTSKTSAATRLGILYDNEEIGSRSKQGADSMLIRDIITKICGEGAIYQDAFALSVDVAHGTHPNYIEKNDITSFITLGQGVVLKSSAAQRYVTDCEAGAALIALSRAAGTRLVRQANRSGMPGGQTLGPILSSYLPVRSADIGIPMLAMHSANELICAGDYIELKDLLTAYYEHDA